MAEHRIPAAESTAMRDRIASLSGSLREVSTADARRVLDRAYAKMATELNCCGCYLGCVMVPVVAVSTGLLVVSILV